MKKNTGLFRSPAFFYWLSAALLALSIFFDEDPNFLLPFGFSGALFVFGGYSLLYFVWLFLNSPAFYRFIDRFEEGEE